MKKIIPIISILILLISCEKDDICTSTDSNTPYLKIKFYNNLDRGILKKVNNLLIVGVDNELSYGTESSRDSIMIPLRTLKNNTSYRLIKNYSINDNGTPNNSSDDFATGNEDEIIINYENQEIYISEACGFKNIYNDINFGFSSDDNNWILNTQVILNNIENENDAHVYIFH